MSRIVQFEAIKKAFFAQDRALLSRGHLPMRSTEKGFWGVSNLDDVYEFFVRKRFPKSTRFIDLGCGDGRVVLVASLFVDASGIEYDSALVENGKKIAAELGMNVTLLQGDMRSVDYSSYDILYFYADQRFDFLESKLLAELRGVVYLYHDTYHPYFLKKGKITWINQIPIFKYEKK